VVYLRNRALFDVLFRYHRGRRKSPDHERVFWQLGGYCLRPGFGDPADATRVAAFVALFPELLAFPAEPRSWQAFWIAWRRVAAGLDGAAQEALRDATDPFLAPSSLRKKRPKSIRAEVTDEMVEMASTLERVSPARRTELGEWILERTWTDRDPRLWSAMGRLGARVPSYASAHHVVAPHVAEHWLDHLLREKWETVPTAAGAAVELARMTGDRARDVREAVRRDVERRLQRVGARPEWLTAVREVVPLEEQERAAAFGEGLPVGLRLMPITS
jgi:DNA-K related protein